MFKFEFVHGDNTVTVIPYEGKMNSMVLARPLFQWAEAGIDETFRISHNATVEIKDGEATVTHTMTSATLTKEEVKAVLAAIDDAGGAKNTGNVTVRVSNGSVEIGQHRET